MHGSRHPGSSQEPDQPSRISSAPNMYCAPIMYQHFTPVPGTQLALVISGHPIHKSWSAIGHLKLFFIMSAFGYEKRARQDPRGSAYVFCHGSLRHAGRWFPEERASHHLGFLVWDGLQCPHCWLSRPPLVFCGLPSSESRVKTETQPKCQVLFCFKFSQGLGRGFSVSPQAFTRAAHFGRTRSPDRSASPDPECSWIPEVIKRWVSGGSWKH